MTPARFWTYTASGGHVTHFSYPAGGFLIDVPAFALGFHHQVVNWMDLGCWILSAIILFVLLPFELRWMAGLVALSPIFVSDFVTGGTAVTFYPFILIAVWRWDRFGTGQGSRAARWAGPLALGLGCAIKQTPWFIVPFLLLGVGIEARRRGRAGTTVGLEHLGLVLVAFGAVNLPFILWHPADWWRGTFLPLGASLVADGQGLVSLATHGLTGGVNLSLFTLAGALAYVTTVAAFALYYERLKLVWPLLVPIGFFFAPRSFTSYLVALFPVALVAATTVTPPDRRRRDRTRQRRVRPWVGPGFLIALSLGTAVTAGVALGRDLPPLAHCTDALGLTHDGSGAIRHHLGAQSDDPLAHTSLHGRPRRRPPRWVLVPTGASHRRHRSRSTRRAHPVPAGADDAPCPALQLGGRRVHPRSRVVEHVVAGLLAGPNRLVLDRDVTET